jgi:uncharacterized protein YggE
MKTPLLAILLGFSFATGAAAEDPPARTVTALGKGVVTARPDAAVIHMVVFSEGALASSTIQDNDVMTERLVDKLHDQGIRGRDIQSHRAGVRPQFRDSASGQGLPTVSGYQVRNDVRAYVRRLDRLGALLDDLGTGAPSLIQNVRLLVGDPDGLYKLARQKAIADARRRAQQYARDAGLELGDVEDIRELSADSAAQSSNAEGADDDSQVFKVNVSVTYSATKRRAVETAPERKPPAPARRGQ